MDFSAHPQPGRNAAQRKALTKSPNRWRRTKFSSIDQDSPWMVDGKVRGLLNKLTVQNFDSISDQIITWANNSEKERDSRTLIQVILLIFETATDQELWSDMYAHLCRKLMVQVSQKVQDDGVRNADNEPIAGGQLFRKYLLNRCQEDFERGWVASKDKPVLFSDKYYADQKAKRQGLGLVKFIGELFKLEMLTERIMHGCTKKLLVNVEDPQEEELESLCMLLTTVGAILDTSKARAHVDVYFARMKELSQSPKVSLRVQFKLQDVIELRARDWIPRVPIPLANVQICKAREYSASKKGGSGPRRPPPKAGSLSNFGKISKPPPMTFGPSSVFTSKKESISRVNSNSNMFTMVSANPEAVDAALTKSRAPSRKASIDLGQAGIPEAPAPRRPLVLKPRSVPVEGDVAAAPSEAPSEAEQDDEEEEGEIAADEMSQEDAVRKITEDVKEFFGVRNLDEAEHYFDNLPAPHHFRLIDKLVAKAVESKPADVQLVSDFLIVIVSKNLCSSAALEEGFMPTAEILDDLAIDAPRAFSHIALMMKAAGLDEEQRSRIASKLMDSATLISLIS